MDEKDVQRINMQLFNRLVKIENENKKLKRAMQDLQWIVSVVEKIKNITEVLNYGNERKSIEQRPTNF